MPCAPYFIVNIVLPYMYVSRHGRVIYGSPVTTRAEEGLRVDSDTLGYLENNEPLCPLQKYGPNPGEAKIQNGRRWPSWKYQNLLS